QTYKVLYAFDGQEKVVAGSNLLRDKAGNLYGASWDSPRMCPGDTPCGAIYKIDPTGKLTTLYQFKNRADGFYPVGLAIDSHGTLYGTTEEGGSSAYSYCGYGCGTVFSLTASGKKTILHSFDAPPRDGTVPGSGLVVLPVVGVLFGVTSFGGSGSSGPEGDGTIYQIVADNHSEKILHNFSFGYDGGLPGGGLLLAGAT